jgi:hypothetical protein
MAKVEGIQHFRADRRLPYPLEGEPGGHLEDLVAYLESLQENRGRLGVYVTSAGLDKVSRDETLLVVGELLARRGHRVLVVDADFLSPGLSATIRGRDDRGFLDLLFYGSSPGPEVLETEGLAVLAAGSFPVTNRVPFSTEDFLRVHRLLSARKHFVLYGGPEQGDLGETSPLAASLDVVLHVGTGEDAARDREVGRFLELGVMEVLALRYTEREIEPTAPEPAAVAEEEKPSRTERIPLFLTAGLAVALAAFVLWWVVTTFLLAPTEETRRVEGPGGVSLPEQTHGPEAGESPAPGGVEGPEQTGSQAAVEGEEPGADRQAAPPEPEVSPAPAEAEGPPTEAGTPEPASVGEVPVSTPAGGTGSVDEAPGESSGGGLWGIPGSGPWAVWLSSFRTESRAGVAVSRWEREGFTARAYPVDLGEKGRWYRVYVGNYPTREAAEAARDFLLADPRVDFAQVRRRPFDD